MPVGRYHFCDMFPMFRDRLTGHHFRTGAFTAMHPALPIARTAPVFRPKYSQNVQMTVKLRAADFY